MSDGNGQLDQLLPPDPATAGADPPLPALDAATAGGRLPKRLPAHLARKLDEPSSDRSAQLAALVAGAVEWGYDDHQVLGLALQHRPTRERQQHKRTNVAADVARLLSKYRPKHPHIGRPCDQAGCANTPGWMRGSTHSPAARQQTNGLTTAAAPAADTSRANGSAAQDLAAGPSDSLPAAPTAPEVPVGWIGPVGELLLLMDGYVHLDDPGHVWFALAVAVSAVLDGDPLWGMLIGPSSSGKTEAIRALDGLAEPVDELTAPALLSWTHGKQPRPTGVLVRIGERGLVTVGDFSTVLATSDRGGRDQLFALLRRAYDGAVTRDLGNAPAPLRWTGRLTLIAACTPAIDNYQSHADQLGPRWLYYRIAAGSAQAKRATSRKARLRAGQLARSRAKAAELATRLVTAAREKATTVDLPDAAAEQLDDIAIVACFGRAVVPRNPYGRRDIEGLAIIEEPPRLVAQLVLLAKGLLALGLPAPAALALCRRAALDSIPAVRRSLLAALAKSEELTASEAARRVGCHRHVARMALEELGAIGLATCPELDDGPDPEEEPGPWTAHPWRLAGPDRDLVRAVLQAPAWHEVWVAPPGGGEGEESGRGGGVGVPHTSCQAPPASTSHHTPTGHVPDGLASGELLCPACGQLVRPPLMGPARCPDCTAELVSVPGQPRDDPS